MACADSGDVERTRSATAELISAFERCAREEAITPKLMAELPARLRALGLSSEASTVESLLCKVSRVARGIGYVEG